jgi:hypothetical protein
MTFFMRKKKTLLFWFFFPEKKNNVSSVFPEKKNPELWWKFGKIFQTSRKQPKSSLNPFTALPRVALVIFLCFLCVPATRAPFVVVASVYRGFNIREITQFALCRFGRHVNPFTASCETAMTLSVPGVPASCEKFPHSSQLNFWSTESIFNQFSVFLKTLNALCVCLQYKHPRSMKRVIRSDNPVALLLLFWSHKCDFGAEPRSRIIATSAVKGLNALVPLLSDYA